MREIERERVDDDWAYWLRWPVWLKHPNLLVCRIINWVWWTSLALWASHKCFNTDWYWIEMMVYSTLAQVVKLLIYPARKDGSIYAAKRKSHSGLR